jgi:prophage regulatory protein
MMEQQNLSFSHGGFFMKCKCNKKLPQKTLATKKTAAASQKTLQHEDVLLRVPQVLKILPICRSSFWAGVKTGIYPKPLKLGPRTTAWRRSEILAIVNGPGLGK